MRPWRLPIAAAPFFVQPEGEMTIQISDSKNKEEEGKDDKEKNKYIVNHHSNIDELSMRNNKRMTHAEMAL